MQPRPLPFRLAQAGDDDMELGEIRSVSWKIRGLLTLTDEGVHLRWTETRTTEKLSLTETGTQVDTFDDWIEFPWERLASVAIAGWLRVRLELRVWDPSDLTDIPSAKHGFLRLKIALGDRALAREVAEEIARRLPR